MRYYTDTTGQKHGIEFTLGTRRKLKDLLGIDLVVIAKEPRQLLQFFERVGEVDELLKLCSAIENLPIEQLEATWNSSTVEAASVAIIEAITDFFPESSPLRKPLLSLMEKHQGQRQMLIDEAEEKLLKAVDEFDFLTEVLKQTTLTSGSVDSQSIAESGSAVPSSSS